MNEIPEDIMKAAKEATRSWKGSGDLEMNIAKALLAERERCLKIAEDVYNDSYAYNGAHDGVEAVISAIRQGQAKEGESA